MENLTDSSTTYVELVQMVRDTPAHEIKELLTDSYAYALRRHRVTKDQIQGYALSLAMEHDYLMNDLGIKSDDPSSSDMDRIKLYSAQMAMRRPEDFQCHGTNSRGLVSLVKTLLSR